MIEQYIVTLDRPDDYSITDMKNYIEEAVSAWGGQRCPSDGMFGCPKVKVKRFIAKE